MQDSDAISDAPLSQSADEAALLAALRAGEEVAFERLVRLFGGSLLRTARRFLGHEQDAQDAVQEAFLSTFKSIDRFKGDARLATWLHRIVVNASLMKLRSKRRKPEQQIDDLLPSFFDDGHQAQPAVEWRETSDTLLQKRETRALVRGCIAKLPEPYREVLLLRDIEEFSTDQTAELLSITKQAVKTRLHRARQALRGLLDPHLRGEPA